MPADVVGEVEHGIEAEDLLALLALDGDGTPVRIELTTEASDRLHLVLGLTGVGAPVTIAPRPRRPPERPLSPRPSTSRWVHPREAVGEPNADPIAHGRRDVVVGTGDLDQLGGLPGGAELVEQRLRNAGAGQVSAVPDASRRGASTAAVAGVVGPQDRERRLGLERAPVVEVLDRDADEGVDDLVEAAPRRRPRPPPPPPR